jgi:hypothetical protein
MRAGHHDVLSIEEEDVSRIPRLRGVLDGELNIQADTQLERRVANPRVFPITARSYYKSEHNFQYRIFAR